MLRDQRLIGLLILAALLLSACQPVAAQPMAQSSDEDVTAAVRAIWDEYEASVVAGDVDRWIAQWTDDGVQMPPNEQFVEGKDNIYARVGARMQAGPTDEMVITALETQSAGDWAYSRGVYSVAFPIGDTGEQGFVDGKFMTILQRQPDGSWKIHRDIYNSNVPPRAATGTRRRGGDCRDRGDLHRVRRQPGRGRRGTLDSALGRGWCATAAGRTAECRARYHLRIDQRWHDAGHVRRHGHSRGRGTGGR